MNNNQTNIYLWILKTILIKYQKIYFIILKCEILKLSFIFKFYRVKINKQRPILRFQPCLFLFITINYNFNIIFDVKKRVRLLDKK